MNNVEETLNKMQKEIDVLKRQMEYLKHLIPNYGDAVSWVTRKVVSDDVEAQ